MLLIPRNRWIQVELAFDETEEEHEKPYKAVSVICDSGEEYKYGDVIIVPTHVIHEIEIRKNRFHLIERNHVMAVLMAGGGSVR